MFESEMPDWKEMLRRVFGEEQAKEMEEKIQRGTPFSSFHQGEGILAFPFQALLGTNHGAVNWDLARLTASGKIGTSHKTVTLADGNLVRAALAEANLRLDAVTSLTPPAADYAAWSPSKWLDESLEVWKILVTPVAQSTEESMRAALGARLSEEEIHVEFDRVPPEMKSILSLFTSDSGGGAAGDTGDAKSGVDGGFSLERLVSVLGANLFALQFGQAWGQLAADSFGSTDIGLPVGKENQAALILENVQRFAKDAEVPEAAALTFLATREAAYVRLYHAVPWLRLHVEKSITDYAADIGFDLEAMERAVESINPMETGAMEKMLGQGALTPQITGKQTEAKQSLETILAITEGWVDAVVTRCLAGSLPQLPPLREMMNRRRATGGPAEKAFASLLGLELRPKRMREASQLWSRLVAKLGPEGAEGIWAHPDILPEEKDFDAIDDYVARLAGEAPKDEVEVALEALLDGSLPYAAGLEPGTDSAGDATAITGDEEESAADTGDFTDQDDSQEPGSSQSS